MNVIEHSISYGKSIYNCILISTYIHVSMLVSWDDNVVVVTQLKTHISNIEPTKNALINFSLWKSRQCKWPEPIIKSRSNTERSVTLSAMTNLISEFDNVCDTSARALATRQADPFFITYHLNENTGTKKNSVNIKKKEVMIVMCMARQRNRKKAFIQNYS